MHKSIYFSTLLSSTLSLAYATDEHIAATGNRPEKPREESLFGPRIDSEEVIGSEFTTESASSKQPPKTAHKKFPRQPTDAEKDASDKPKPDFAAKERASVRGEAVGSKKKSEHLASQLNIANL